MSWSNLHQYYTHQTMVVYIIKHLRGRMFMDFSLLNDDFVSIVQITPQNEILYNLRYYLQMVKPCLLYTHEIARICQWNVLMCSDLPGRVAENAISLSTKSSQVAIICSAAHSWFLWHQRMRSLTRHYVDVPGQNAQNNQTLRYALPSMKIFETGWCTIQSLCRYICYLECRH